LLCARAVVSSSSWIMLEFCFQIHYWFSCPNQYCCTMSSVFSGNMGDGVVASYSLHDSLNMLPLWSFPPFFWVLVIKLPKFCHCTLDSRILTDFI
jgi:hypothetical protein